MGIETSIELDTRERSGVKFAHRAAYYIVQVDLLCTSPASEVFYYPEHLPILGVLIAYSPYCYYVASFICIML